MSLSLAIALNIIVDVVLLGGLGYAMSQPRHLTRHAIVPVQ